MDRLLILFLTFGTILSNVNYSHCELHYDSKTRTLYQKIDSKAFNSIVMGDWGGLPIPPYYSPFEQVTAQRMMKHASKEQFDFLLALGDNFYENGVTDENDARFEETFEKVFGDSSFKNIPWMVLAGNHDHYGNVTGELAYSHHSSRWNFWDLWYSIEVQRSDFNTTIIMVDTVTLCGNTAPDIEGGQPEGTNDFQAVQDQLTFIENKLKGNVNPYIFVAGHFPVYSIAEHGPTQCLLDKLKPLLEKYQVTAYLCGHDHNLQHIRTNTSTVEYFLSGAVDVVDPSKKHENAVPPGSLQFYWANILGLGGYATLNGSKEQLEFKFYSAVGAKLYSYPLKPRK